MSEVTLSLLRRVSGLRGISRASWQVCAQCTPIKTIQEVFSSRFRDQSVGMNFLVSVGGDCPGLCYPRGIYVIFCHHSLSSNCSPGRGHIDTHSFFLFFYVSRFPQSPFLCSTTHRNTRTFISAGAFTPGNRLMSLWNKYIFGWSCSIVSALATVISCQISVQFISTVNSNVIRLARSQFNPLHTLLNSIHLFPRGKPNCRYFVKSEVWETIVSGWQKKALNWRHTLDTPWQRLSTLWSLTDLLSAKTPHLQLWFVVFKNKCIST